MNAAANHAPSHALTISKRIAVCTALVGLGVLLASSEARAFVAGWTSTIIGFSAPLSWFVFLSFFLSLFVASMPKKTFPPVKHMRSPMVAEFSLPMFLGCLAFVISFAIVVATPKNSNRLEKSMLALVDGEVATHGLTLGRTATVNVWSCRRLVDLYQYTPALVDGYVLTVDARPAEMDQCRAGRHHELAITLRSHRA